MDGFFEYNLEEGQSVETVLGRAQPVFWDNRFIPNFSVGGKIYEYEQEQNHSYQICGWFKYKTRKRTVDVYFEVCDGYDEKVYITMRVFRPKISCSDETALLLIIADSMLERKGFTVDELIARFDTIAL